MPLHFMTRRAVRDPDHRAGLTVEFEAGHHSHPNRAGNRALADAFNLSTFLK